MKFLKNKTILSFLFPIIIFAITYLLIGFKYCTDDDGTMSRIVSSGYITPYSLIWISYFSHFIHKTIPFVSGWGLFILGSTYFAICKLTNMILSFKNKHIKIISLITLTIITIDILIQCNFTKASFIILYTGFLCIQIFLEQKEKKNLLFSILFIVIGYSLRPDTLYTMIPFFGVYILIKLAQNKEKKVFLKELLIYSVICVILLSCSLIDNINLKNSLGEYIEFNKARSQYLDHHRERIKQDKTVDVNKLTSASPNDIIAFNNYFFGDDDFFTTEKIKEINQEIAQLNNYVKTLPKKTLINFVKTIFHPLGIILLYLLLISLKNKENFIYLLGVFLFSFVFACISRYPDRIVFCVIISSCLTLLYQLKDKDCLYIKKNLKILFNLVLTISIFFKFLIPIVVIFNTTTMPINNYINEHIENNYLIGYSMTIEKQCETDVLSRETDDLKENFIVTSWILKHPFYESILRKRNIENINSDLIEKDNYYLVTYEDDKDCIIMEKYLEEHYYKDINYELVDEINKYKVWKFYKEE